MRCLDKGLVPVSLKLKNHIRTQRGKSIIEKAGKQLLKERIKSINYKLDCSDHDRYMYMNELKDIVGEDQEIWKACLERINKRREIRHGRVMERQAKSSINCLRTRKIKYKVVSQNIRVTTQRKRKKVQKK